MVYSALGILLLHAAKDAVIVLIAAATGDLVVFFVVCGTALALFHLVSAHVDLVTSVALGLSRVVNWRQCTAREGTLA